MRRFKTIPPKWAAAARADAQAPMSTFHRDEIDITKIVIGPHRVRIRVAKIFPPDVLTPRKLLARRAIYVKQPPRCRECGQPIKHGESAIRYGYNPTRFNAFLGTVHFIHEEPCQ